MEQRVVEVAYDNKIGHVGSCLTTVSDSRPYI